MFIGSRTYVHKAGNLCSEPYEHICVFGSVLLHHYLLTILDIYTICCRHFLKFAAIDRIPYIMVHILTHWNIDDASSILKDGNDTVGSFTTCSSQIGFEGMNCSHLLNEGTTFYQCTFRISADLIVYIQSPETYTKGFFFVYMDWVLSSSRWSGQTDCRDSQDSRFQILRQRCHSPTDTDKQECRFRIL